MKPRLLFLNRSYWPDTEATGQLLTALCEGLTDQFDVHVLAGQPNVPSTSTDWKNIEERNGVTIHRVKHTTFSKRNMLQKGINFLSFVRACQKQIRLLPQPDVVVFETDPFLLPFVADRFHRYSGCSMVGYLQDIYPDVAVALEKVGNNRAIRKLRSSLFDIYRRCSRMIVLSKDMKQLLLESEIPDESVSIIPNWADTQQIVPVESSNRFRRKFRLEKKFVAMYSGNLGLTQNLEEFVEAAAILQDDTEIQFVFVGQGARKKTLQQQTESLGLSNILFCDYQPIEELSHSLSAADLHLLPLTAGLSRCLMPSKLYGILAAGRPFLTNAPETSELFELTKSHHVGFTVEAGCPSAIAEAVRTAKTDRATLKNMGQRARQLAEDRFTKTLSVSAFAKSLQEVTRESSKQVIPTTRTTRLRKAILKRVPGHGVIRRRLPPKFGRRSCYIPANSDTAFVNPGFTEFKSLIRIASECIREGDRIWDIGGTTGLFSILAAHQAGHRGNVLSVQPDPNLAALIQRTSEHADNRDLTIDVLCASVSAETKIAQICPVEQNQRYRSPAEVLNGMQTVLAKQPQFSPATTLDSMLSVFSPPTFIRIDVEDAQQLILEGGKRLIEEYRPRICVIVEEKQIQSVKAILSSFGYDLLESSLPVSGREAGRQDVFNMMSVPSEQPLSQLASAA
ncbi:MAG: FkbM family methyltransferase [Fuerstiella sp.]|nr:FkbM family methyltransferase [Fuerstiella sp.]